MRNETFSWKKMLSLFSKFPPSYCSVAVSGPGPTGTKLGLPRFLHSSISFGRRAFLLKLSTRINVSWSRAKLSKGLYPLAGQCCTSPGLRLLAQCVPETHSATHVSFDFNMGLFWILCSKMWIWIQMSLNTSQQRNLLLSPTIKCVSIFN